MLSKTFLSIKRANEFASVVNGTVWTDRDNFGQKIYIVKWWKREYNEEA